MGASNRWRLERPLKILYHLLFLLLFIFIITTILTEKLVKHRRVRRQKGLYYPLPRDKVYFCLKIKKKKFLGEANLG